MARAILRTALVSGVVLVIAPLLTAQSASLSPHKPAKFVFLLPDGFRGWVCVDFGIAGAKPLPREGEALVISPHKAEVLETSDKIGTPILYGEAWYEVDGKRRRLPGDVTVQPGPMRGGPREPTERSCAFVGTTDELDAAGPPPGFESLHQRTPIPVEERQALETLYRAADGDHWTHRVGWLGPAGTECDWHGVECVLNGDSEHVVELSLDENNLVGEIPSGIGQLRKLSSLGLGRNRLTGTIPATLGELTDLEWLDLSRNGLTGVIPATLGQLNKLEWLYLYGNHFSGLLPESLIRKALSGPLAISAEAPLLTDVSEIDFESASSAALCATHRVVLHANGSLVLYTQRCRNASPNDRTTFCEVKQGHLDGGEFARLGSLIHKDGFFGLNSEYNRNITHATFENTRVTANGKTRAVSNYAGAGPFELWAIQRAIEGVAAGVEWEKTETHEKCPRW